MQVHWGATVKNVLKFGCHLGCDARCSRDSSSLDNLSVVLNFENRPDQLCGSIYLRPETPDLEVMQAKAPDDLPHNRRCSKWGHHSCLPHFGEQYVLSGFPPEF